MNILIYGSCVTRDAFRLIKTKHRITGFVSRNPLASAFRGRPASITLADIDPTGILSDNFPRRMLELNLSAGVPAYLREKAKESDVIVIDMIDDRLPLIDCDGDAVCYCQELARVYQPEAYQRIPYDSARRSKMTDFGISALMMLAQECKIPLLLNPAKWSTHPDGGRETLLSAQRNIELERLFKMFKSRGVPMVDYGDHVFMPDIDHTWGAAPYHYTRPTYEILLQGIDDWAARRAAVAAS